MDHKTTEYATERSLLGNDELMEKVRRIADPLTERKKQGPLKAKTLQDQITYLFDETVRTDKEAHILAWMVLIYMHTELENNSIWSLPPLYTREKMSSIFNFIYHLSNDLGNVTVMEGLAQRDIRLACTSVKKVYYITQITPIRNGQMLAIPCMDT